MKKVETTPELATQLHIEFGGNNYRVGPIHHAGDHIPPTSHLNFSVFQKFSKYFAPHSILTIVAVKIYLKGKKTTFACKM